MKHRSIGRQSLVYGGPILLALISTSLLMVRCGGASGPSSGKGKRLMVLAIDGMDYGLLKRFMAEGKMPNFQALAEEGDFVPLATTIPPQSPVAWSSFITGLNPGHTGIFDFVHRDPATMLPYLSTTRVEGAGRTLSLGKWVLPLSGGKAVQLRQGKPWWEMLEERGVPATVIKIPANFPAEGQRGRVLSGMGTPDIQGTYGQFSFFTTRPYRSERTLSGGDWIRVKVEDHMVRAALIGPANTFLKENPQATMDFTVYLDPEYPLAKVRISISGEEFLLKEGEWSEWVEVEFELIPYLQSVSSVCRFYLKQVRPEFELYVTPVNLNPAYPALPISSPPEFSAEIAAAIGPFYTQGMPEDTKALAGGVFEDEDFLRQADLVFRERKRMYEHFLEEFDSGVLFFYFSSIDQASHVLWRTMDPEHPAHNPERDAEHADAIENSYVEMDGVLGMTREKLGPETPLLVLSDHGFAPWYRAFHLNTWLKDNGYLVLLDPSRQGKAEYLTNVDWFQTRAYGLGINGLYINLLGREVNGIVPYSERDALVDEISGKLLEVRDPENGAGIISKVYRSDKVFSGLHLGLAPDIIVGFRRGYRNSNESSAGKVPLELIKDNREKWSGDHCIAADEVPGVLLGNRKFSLREPALTDLAPTILAEFGLEAEGESDGQSIW